MKKKLIVAGLVLSSLLGHANAAIINDADVTNNVIFGSGVDNGAFTVFRGEGIELGLRGKLRHNASGNPENTFNSNGDGTYSFDAGQAFGQSASTGVWSFEWSINTDFEGTSGDKLVDYTYVLLVDVDPSAAQSFVPFNIMDPTANLTDGFWDHSIGNNSTAQGDGDEATDLASYTDLVNDNNLAQNSWKPHWFNPAFDPTVDGVYTYSLSVSDGQRTIGTTSIDIIVGQGATAVPEPSTLALLGLGFLGLVFRKKLKQ